MEPAEELPGDAMDILHKIRQGTLSINLEYKGLNELTATIDHLSNRVAPSLIIASLIIGSAPVLQQEAPPMIVYGYSIMGITGYLLAAVLGLGLAIFIVRSSLRARKK